MTTSTTSRWSHAMLYRVSISRPGKLSAKTPQINSLSRASPKARGPWAADNTRALPGAYRRPNRQFRAANRNVPRRKAERGWIDSFRYRDQGLQSVVFAEELETGRRPGAGESDNAELSPRSSDSDEWLSQVRARCPLLAVLKDSVPTGLHRSFVTMVKV